MRALDLLAADDVEIEACAAWRKTPAFPAGSGPAFVNGAARAKTALPARELLCLMHKIEASLGRQRRDRWGSRTCDLDLIAYGDAIVPDAETLRAHMDIGAETAGATPAPDQMILPHPRMHERAFVLAPLSDVAPDWRHPATGASVVEMLAALGEGALEEIEVLGG